MPVWAAICVFVLATAAVLCLGIGNRAGARTVTLVGGIDGAAELQETVDTLNALIGSGKLNTEIYILVSELGTEAKAAAFILAERDEGLHLLDEQAVELWRRIKES